MLVTLMTASEVVDRLERLFLRRKHDEEGGDSFSSRNRSLSRTVHEDGLLIEIDVSAEFAGRLPKSLFKGIVGYAFVDGAFLIAVKIPGDLLKPGSSIDRSVYDCEDDIHAFFKLVLKQVTIAHRVIDWLYGDRPERPA